MAFPEFPMRVQSWKERGHIEKFRGYDIHCYYHHGESDGPLHVICHGYPTCSYDWKEVLEQAPLKFKSVLLFDFLGFGLSDKPECHNYSLSCQADLVEELIQRHNDLERDVILIGHDMGVSVVAELISRDIDSVLNKKIGLLGAFLFNGSMFMERANLILGQRLLRSPLGALAAKCTFPLLFKWQLGSVFSRNNPLSKEEGEDQWALMSYQNGHKINDKLIKYTFERVEKADRWLGAVRNWKKPISYAWAMEDPVCGKWQLEGWKELRPQNNVIEMFGLGHYPQIEDPQQFSNVMNTCLDALNI